MRIIGNALNGDFFSNIVRAADTKDLEHIRLAVAYVRKMDELFDLAKRRSVPLTLYALMDGNAFPSIPILKRFVRSSPISWRLFLTANFYHPKIYWFQGIGAYIGSANLTDNGWNRNLECGVWLDDSELDRDGVTDELAAMFQVLSERCVAASNEHIEIFEQLASARTDLRRAQSSFEETAKRALQSIPGQAAPIDVTKRDKPGGAARRAFVAEWHQTLTLLRKLTQQVKDIPWPDWIDPEVHPAIAQDQATEHWYHHNIRNSGQSSVETGHLHAANRGRPAQAVAEMFKAWSESSADDVWVDWTNNTPQDLRRLLARDELRRLDEARLTEILWGGHASREHARQIRNSILGIGPDEHHSKEVRCELYARFLLSQQTTDGKRISDVLDYVLWGDERTPECPERIWDAIRNPKWHLPHLGVSILGELVGYARPDDFPPRNNRVSRTLFALGFEDVSW